MKSALDEAGEDARHYFDMWKAAEAREARLRAALEHYAREDVWAVACVMHGIFTLYDPEKAGLPGAAGWERAREALGYE